MTTKSATLQITKPDGTEESYTLSSDRPVQVGRTADMDLVLPHSEVSRRHARFYCDEQGFLVEDVGSTNGTLRNGRLIEGPERLSHGDTVKIGPFRMRYLSCERRGARVDETARQSTLDSLSVEDFVAGGKMTGAPVPAAAVAGRAATFLQNIDRVGNALLAVRPMNELLEEIVDLADRILTPERVALLMCEEGELKTRAVRQKGGDDADEITISLSIAKEAMEERQALIVGDALSDDRFLDAQSVVNLRIRSAMCAPLWNGSDVSGILYVDSRAAAVPFAKEDLQLLTLIAHLSAVKIRETAAFEELQEKRRLEEEMRYAAAIQKRLLPEKGYDEEGIVIAGKNISSFQVGGDFFDYMKDAEGRIWAGLGDVSGKGMSAALLMSGLHSTLRALVDAGATLEEASVRLNSAIMRDSQPEQFITLFLLTLDPAAGEIRFINAGHNFPFLLRSTGEVKTLEAGGLMLGAFPGIEQTTSTVTLEEGDALLIYSDGITEARNAEGEEFAEERVIDFLKAHASEDAHCLVELLLDEVIAFAEGGGPMDDLTALLVRRKPQHSNRGTA